MKRFKDRREAGEQLGMALRAYRDVPKVTVLGLPRGGVVVAAELAKALNATMDVFVVRKLGAPESPELAMGALASGGVRVLNQDVIRLLGITVEALDSVTNAEQRELQRRETAYRPDAPPLDLTGQTAILADDGLATGATMRAAVRAARELKPAHIVVAVPVAAPDSLETIQAEADEVTCLMAPESFQAVGKWYEQFEQVSDDEVRDLMSRQEQQCGWHAGSRRHCRENARQGIGRRGGGGSVQTRTAQKVNVDGQRFRRRTESNQERQ